RTGQATLGSSRDALGLTARSTRGNPVGRSSHCSFPCISSALPSEDCRRARLCLRVEGAARTRGLPTEPGGIVEKDPFVETKHFRIWCEQGCLMHRRALSWPSRSRLWPGGSAPETRLLELPAEDVDGREDFGARILEHPRADGGHCALDDVHIARWQTRKNIAMRAPSHSDGLRVGDPDRRAVLNVELEASRERGQLIE